MKSRLPDRKLLIVPLHDPDPWHAPKNSERSTAIPAKTTDGSQNSVQCTVIFAVPSMYRKLSTAISDRKMYFTVHCTAVRVVGMNIAEHCTVTCNVLSSTIVYQYTENYVQRSVIGGVFLAVHY